MAAGVSCGITVADGVKLKDCSACHLVKYCSVKCQRDHRPQHKRGCKKRVAELRDELLFARSLHAVTMGNARSVYFRCRSR
eukprot:scaffold32715_cov160-Skeletonema_menzelii.AAC.1